MKLTTQINGMERQLELSKPSPPDTRYAFSLDGTEGEADIEEISPALYSILLGSQSFEVKIEMANGAYAATVGGCRHEVVVRDPRKLSRAGAGAIESGPQKLTAPMPGKVVSVMVEEGQQVESGQGLLVVEAMKMQNEIKSPKDGTVKTMHVKQGGSVKSGEVLLVVE